MSTIRRQSIIASIIIYIGFALGFLNTYLFTMEGGFTKAQYGLTGTFIAIANIMLSVASVGMQGYIYKFYPYYRDNLPPRKNDMMTVALSASFLGFLLIIVAGIVFKDFVVRKYSGHSPDLIRYYNWLFPFGFGLTIYSLLEVFAWQLRKTPLTNFLREVLFRLLTTVLIGLSFIGVIRNFDHFIKLYAFTYIAIALALLIYLVYTKQLYFPRSISRVTKKFKNKILTLIGFTWAGGLVFNISNVFDTIVIAAVMPNGLAYVGIYTLAQNMGSLVQAPQRGLASSTIAPLSSAWKNKDYSKINLIYHRSSINQLIFSVGMFMLIWMNFTDGVLTFHLQKDYLAARWVFFYIGLMRIVDLGTGVNAQIIATSTRWRFDFVTGVILLSLALPMNYIFTKTFGVIGPAVSNLIAFSIYNAIRYVFLLKRYNMQPFNKETAYTVALGLVAYGVCQLLLGGQSGFLYIVLRSTLFLAIYISGVLLLKLSPDVLPVWQTVKKRIGIRP